MEEKMSFKNLFNTVLNGMALGIVAGLIANAVLGTLFKYLGTLFLPDVFAILTQAVFLLQFAVPPLIGVAIGMQMKFNPMETAVLSAAILAGSGSIVFNKELKAYTTTPMGDLFNVLLVSLIAVLIITAVRGKFGSLTIIFLPIVGGALPAAIGLVTLPYMKQITKFLADIVLTFTTLQPLLMCMLIAMSFSLFIVTPVSTVAMGIILFSNANHLGAGAAALGVVSAAAVLMLGSIKAKNPKGVSWAILLGAIKLMMPNCARQPLLLVPIMATAAVTGLAGYFFNILGDQTSAGFGIIGLVGPVKAYEMANSGLGAWAFILISYVAVPFVVGFVMDKLFSDVLKLYKKEAYSTDSL
ncbi:PTS transporter subunit IIC [Gemelliphila palaticanis]|uniref:PTS transporter subunit IIC n=1 Tax=Gemelliphila palaticanis TaxID=81950 RepID=A0ABX2T338_9BACL|nr:PTS sugar transporter subunit IIC [Gemella palaticanis]MBF0715964.1 PTS transporter subunit IIC [Gemella palaticanis]NYS47894.1 PTS transporter subunit IIC [Gemella palaticanis]